MRLRIIAVALVTVVGLGISAGLGWWLYTSNTRTRQIMYAEEHGLDKDIAFYGAVVDASHGPVADAKVLISIERANWRYRYGALQWMEVEELTRTTDAQGRFSVEGQSGKALQIKGIEKPGFEWVIDVDSERQNEGYDFSTRMGICYLPDRARPAVLAVRQAGSSERVRMSRGGSDRLFDGRIRINQEAEPLQAASFRRGQWVYDK